MASADLSPDAARMWRADDLGGVDLLTASLTGFSFRPHSHEDFFVALTERGQARPAYRRATHAVGPGDLIVLNPEEAHAGGPASAGTWAYRAVYVRPALMHGIMRELLAGRSAMPAFGGDVVRDPEVATHLRRFHLLAERAGAGALERASELTTALALLAGRHAAPSPARFRGREPAAVRRSREYLEEHARENVTLEALARVAGLSPFHLIRVFREAVGMTPHAYQTQVRVRHATSLLRAGRPIALAAAEAGFYDQAHFTRHFKRIMGLTPGRYAKDVSAPGDASPPGP